MDAIAGARDLDSRPPALWCGRRDLLVSSLQRNFNRRLASFDANSGEELWRFEWTPG